MLSDIVEINYSPVCHGVAKKLSQGLDNGDGNGTAADGQLHVDEIDKTEIICLNIFLLKDIHFGSGDSAPVHFTVAGSNLYFSASDGTHGNELWMSDGTSNGTVMVKDINSGSGDSMSQNGYDLYHLTSVGNTVYFSADDGINGLELWKSDGTANGTMMVKDINSGSGSSSPNHLTAVGNTVYFAANDGTNGSELWKSDGTGNGTVMEGYQQWKWRQ